MRPISASAWFGCARTPKTSLFMAAKPASWTPFRPASRRIIENWWGIIKRRKKLTWLTTGYGQLAIVFPFIVAAPRYFNKVIQLGGLMQIASAFGQVQDSLSFIISSYTEIAQYQAVVQRLSGFRARMDEIAAERQAVQPIAIERGGVGVEVEALDLDLPDGSPLRHDLALSAGPGNALLITGPSGAGKSTLLRALAGLWPFGRGRVRVADGDALFLPQRPYLPLGTLADALAYPRAAAGAGAREPRRGVARRRAAAAGRAARRGGELGAAPIDRRAAAACLCPGAAWRARRSFFSTRRPRRSTRQRKCRSIGCCATRPGSRRSSASAITDVAALSRHDRRSRAASGVPGGGRMRTFRG